MIIIYLEGIRSVIPDRGVLKKFTCNRQIDSNPSQSYDPVLLLDAKEVHDHQDDCDQDVDEWQGVEELSGNKKCCKEIKYVFVELCPSNNMKLFRVSLREWVSEGA